VGKTAFIFPGQGAQYSGMGKDIFDNNAAARKAFMVIDSIRPGTSKQCFFGTEDELKVTENTQPCIFATEIALAHALKDAGIMPDAVAGFSLGEITALTFSEVFSFENGFRFICNRAKYMQEDAEKAEASMVAVVKLANNQVEELAQKFSMIFPVNYNCPGQLVVAGDKEQLNDFSALVKENGGKAIPLAVGGGFHSPYMKNAAAKIKEELSEKSFGSPMMPVYSNYTSYEYTDDVARLLSNQTNHPVMWHKIVENMIHNGIDTFIEVGPGKVLSGFVKKISSDVRVFNVQTQEDIEALKEQL